MNYKTYIKERHQLLSQYLLLPYILTWCSFLGNGGKPPSRPLWSAPRCKVSTWGLAAHTYTRRPLDSRKHGHLALSRLLSQLCTHKNVFNPLLLISLKLSQGHFTAEGYPLDWWVLTVLQAQKIMDILIWNQRETGGWRCGVEREILQNQCFFLF